MQVDETMGIFFAVVTALVIMMLSLIFFNVVGLGGSVSGWLGGFSIYMCVCLLVDLLPLHFTLISSLLLVTLVVSNLEKCINLGFSFGGLNTCHSLDLLRVYADQALELQNQKSRLSCDFTLIKQRRSW